MREARSFGCDLIHAHLYEGAIAGFLPRLRVGVPLIADLQDSASEVLISTGAPRILVRIASAIEFVVAHRVDHILTSTPLLARWIENRFGIPRRKVTSLPDAVDTRLFDPQVHRPHRDSTLSSWGIPPGRTVICYVGMITRRQGAHILLETIRRAIAARKPWHFIVAGPAEHPFESEFASLVRSGRVTFLGPVDYLDCVPRLLGASDIGISPKLSTSEGNGKLLHYMAMGLPVVTRDLALHRDIVGDHGVYVRSDDPEDWLDGIALVAENPALREQVGYHLRERAVTHFSWDARIRTLLGVYRGILQGHRSSRGRARQV
jgi:glycosyltransferase involved in cell wall biosynthesis